MHHHRENIGIGLIQAVADGDIERNIAGTVRAIRQAAERKAQIVCLQELFRTPYFCHTEDRRYFEWAEPVPGPTTTLLQSLAKELGIVIIAPLFERRANGLYHNTAAVIDADGSYLGKYRKQHIPDDPGFYEKFYFASGDTGYQVFHTQYARIGVLICWDQWYPEAARITSLMDAEILFFPTAIGWDMDEKSDETNREQFEAWQIVQRSHAIANGVHVVTVNRTGVEHGTQFWGGSFVVNPFGTVLYQASHSEAAVHVQPIDLKLSEHYRTLWPFLRDRRIDTYAPLQRRFIDT
ncbi:MAG: carbon-nitrogen hydrolase [Bacteroidales bacterium]|jgi:N-carbamoylputrescine amidase|nr:carbon-nitrogen hydrolase [Bacteroidales bacterium]